jgi:hypothetical protein
LFANICRNVNPNLDKFTDEKIHHFLLLGKQKKRINLLYISVFNGQFSNTLTMHRFIKISKIEGKERKMICNQFSSTLENNQHHLHASNGCGLLGSATDATDANCLNIWQK